MAANFIDFNRQTDVGRSIVRALGLVREGRELLRQLRAVMLQMRDGDGSQAAHYDLLRIEAGYEAGDYATADAAAKASFDELDSLHAKLTTDASVSDVLTAVDQACAKHGV